MTQAITLHQSKLLVALEATIERGKRTFVDVGLALAKIRDEKLYVSDYETFEAYCKGRWGWHKAYCNHIIRAADTVKELPGELATMVASERQARELSKAKPAEREAVLGEAASRGPLTAKTISQAVRRRKSPSPPSEPEPEEKPQVIARDPAEALGNLQAARVITAFQSWFDLNFHCKEVRTWALGLIVEQADSMLKKERQA